jgi:predicted transcriptional regulator
MKSIEDHEALGDDQHDQEEEFLELSPEEEASLLEAIAEADAGDFVDGEEVLRQLRSQR